MTAIFEDVHLKRLAEELSEREGQLVFTPTYKQVWTFVHFISKEASVSNARSGLKLCRESEHHHDPLCSSIPYPAHICQVDEHTFDQLIVASDGTAVTRRVHAAVLICVKTAAILGAILSLDTLNEEDYMRLVKQTLEPKDRLIALYECKHRWPCFGKPQSFFMIGARYLLLSVRRSLGGSARHYNPAGTSLRSISKRDRGSTVYLGDTQIFPSSPWNNEINTEGSWNLRQRREAEKAGITLDVLEKLFIQAIVDGYMQEWDKLRRQKRMTLWEDSVSRKRGTALDGISG